MRSSFAFAVLGLFLVACGEDDGGSNNNNTNTDAGPYNVSVTGVGFTFHNGQQLHAVVVKDSDGSIVGGLQDLQVANGGYTLSWTDILTKGTAYSLRYWIDLSGNSACDAPPTDHGWNVSLGTASADVTHQETHNTNFTDVCSTFAAANGPFDLSAAGSGFGFHNGDTLHGLVKETTGGTVVGTEQTTTVSGGAWTLGWTGILATGTAYTLEYYVDINGNSGCDASPTDHVWSASIGTVNANKSLSLGHSTNFDDAVCADF